MGNGHRARADGHDGQRGGERRGQPQRAHQGAFRRVQAQNTRRRRDGHGGRALRRLEDGRDDEREEDADVGQEGRMLGDVGDDARVGDDLAQHAARGGDEQDRADGAQRLIRQRVEFLALARREQRRDGDDQTDGQRDHRRAQELENLREEPRPLGHIHDGLDGHQDNRHDDRRKGDARARKLAELGLQLVIALGRLVAVLIGRVNLLADVARVEVARRQRRDGDQEAHQNDHQHVAFKPQRLRRGDRARRRRDEHVRGIQAGAQRDRHRDGGNAGLLDDGLSNRVEDDVAGVAEHGNGDDPAHQQDGQFRVLVAHAADDPVGHGERGAGLFKEEADHRAQNDDDAQRGERAREARADGARHLGQRQRQQRQNQRHAHDGQERMNLKFRNGDDHHDDHDEKGDNQRNTGHKNIPPSYIWIRSPSGLSILCAAERNRWMPISSSPPSGKKQKQDSTVFSQKTGNQRIQF